MQNKYKNRGKQITPDTDLKPGQAIMMNLPVPSTGTIIGPHPWLILAKDEETVEVVPCRTIDDPKRNKYRSNRDFDFKSMMRNDFKDSDKYNDFYIAPDKQNPPFSSDIEHTTAVETKERTIIPLIKIYEMKNTYLKKNGGQLDSTVFDAIKRDSYKKLDCAYDPYDYMNLDNGINWDVEEYKKTHPKPSNQIKRNYTTTTFTSEPSNNIDFA